MADMTTILGQQVIIVRPRYVLYFIHSMLSAMQQTGYDLQIWFHHRLSLAKFVFSFQMHMRYFKRGKERRLFSSIRVIYD